MIATITVVLACLWFSLIALSLLWRNFKAHKFFKTRSPQLPTVPNPSILTGHALQIIASDKNWKIIEELHKEYGPTFGFYMVDQPWVATMDLDLIKLIEFDEAHKHTNRAHLNIPFTEFNHSIFQIDDDRWRSVRRIISPALSNHKVRSVDVTSDIESVVSQLANSMERRSKEAHDATGGRSASFELDARDLAERYALAVIFLVGYKQSNVIDFNADRDTWTHELNTASREVASPLVYASMIAPTLEPLFEWLNQFTITGKCQRRIVNYIMSATKSNHLARERHQRSLQSRKLARANGDACRPSGGNFADVKLQGNFKRRLVDTIIDSLFEGQIGLDNFLAKNEEIQNRLRQSILEEGIDADYVMWCINETVRYHPAVPLGTGRILGEDVQINGQFLAKGTFVMPTTHAIHHDASIWPEPGRFNPDRWRDRTSWHPAQFVGFGLGPRNCVGGKLAVHEIKLVMRTLLANYRIEACDETPAQWQFTSPGLIFTLNDRPIKVRFVPLQPTEPARPA